MSFRCVYQSGPVGTGDRVGAGVFWTECRSWLRNVLIAAAAILPLVALWSFVQHMQQPGGGLFPYGWTAASLLGLEAFCLMELRDRPERNRSLYFLSDGSTWAPDGFTGHHGYQAMPYEQADIVSFEALRCDAANGQPVHRVAAYLRNGDVMHVAAGLTMVEAHKVAVQLSNALQAMRAWRALASLGAGNARETIID